MPTTLLGLVVFVVLLAPGLVYVSSREFLRERTRPDHSAFRETGQVALVSIGCDAVVLAVLVVLRATLSTHTPDVGSLVRGPHAYSSERFAYVATWSVALLSCACLLALALAYWLPISERLAFHSAWWALFEDNRPDGTVAVVSCTLEDGSWLQGRLYTYSRDDKDTADREFTLTAPLRFRAVGARTDVPLPDQAVSVSARRLMFVSVSYVAEAAPGED